MNGNCICGAEIFMFIPRIDEFKNEINCICVNCYRVWESDPINNILTVSERKLTMDELDDFVVRYDIIDGWQAHMVVKPINMLDLAVC